MRKRIQRVLLGGFGGCLNGFCRVRGVGAVLSVCASSFGNSVFWCFVERAPPPKSYSRNLVAPDLAGCKKASTSKLGCVPARTDWLGPPRRTSAFLPWLQGFGGDFTHGAENQRAYAQEFRGAWLKSGDIEA